MQGLETAIEQCITFLENSQRPDGAFDSLSIADGKAAESNTTTFHTSVILHCLKNCKENYRAANIIKKSCQFLLYEKSEHWSWNYWARHTIENCVQKCPNDLDDTSWALATLTLYMPELINEEALSHLTQNLLRAETAEGGPYNTWLVSKKIKNTWLNIDPAVNSSIGYLLNMHNVKLPRLQAYIEHGIDLEAYVSAYYSPLVIAYFISRYYTGNLKDKACDFILKQQNKDGYWNTPLETALAISSLISYSFDSNLLTTAVSTIVEICQHRSWSFCPFYIEEKMPHTTYSGSPTLTAALCLEALLMHTKNNNRHFCDGKKAESNLIHTNAIKYVTEKYKDWNVNTSKTVSTMLNSLIMSDPCQQITLLTYHFFKLLKYPADYSSKLITKLGSANLFGWLSYRIFDDLLDCEGSTQYLPIAATALRETIKIYFDVVPQENLPYILDLFESMDRANSWERHHCFIKSRDLLQANDLPEYSGYSILSDKSIGHAFGPLIILFKMGFECNSTEVNETLSFFRYYLQARQLNDDAHDWLFDLNRGFINSVSSKILKYYLKKNPSVSLSESKKLQDELQKIFWNHIIDDITNDILGLIAKARACLSVSNLFIDCNYFEDMLKPLEAAAEKALAEKKKVELFVKHFQEKRSTYSPTS